MAGVGYSGTLLIKKIEIKPEMKVLVIHEPEAYFNLLGMNISDQSKTGIPDLILESVHIYLGNIIREFTLQKNLLM